MKFGNQIAQITPNLWLCGIANIKEETLRERQINYILNTAEELTDFNYPRIDGLHVEHIVMRDKEDENLLAYLDICVDYIHKTIHSGGNILVHCVAGVSRSASVCIAYLVKYMKMTLRKAYFHILHKRPCIFPNFGFWRQLVTYEENLRGSNSVEMLPFIFGTVPDPFIRDAEQRIKFAWMRELMLNWTLHFMILGVQILSLIFQGQDS